MRNQSYHLSNNQYSLIDQSIKQSKIRSRCSPPNEFSKMQTVEREENRLMFPALRFLITPVALFVYKTSQFSIAIMEKMNRKARVRILGIGVCLELIHCVIIHTRVTVMSGL